MYAGRELASVTESSHLLDRWIMARLNATTVEVEAALDRYEVDRAARPIDNFIDDLSNWYIRRSRERFKSVDEADRLAAISTTSLVLHELALIVAPFMPFMAEQIYQKIKSNADPASVHLASWPVAEVQSGDQEVIDQMVKVRELVSAALLERATAGVKVRQPLGRLLIGVKLEPAYEDIIKDEVNVKEVVYADTLSKTVDLDLTLTDELKGEGVVRELSRRIQDERKAKGLQPDDVITLELSSSAAGQTLVKKFETSLARTVGASTISYQTEPVGAVMVIDELEFSFRF
jgi:isoleucyl-tRNA synthetase